MDNAIKAIKDGMEAAIISVRSEFEQTINSRVEGGPVSVAPNGHADQHNVATTRGVENNSPTPSTPGVTSVAARHKLQ
jgi:hypothetical protein